MPKIKLTGEGGKSGAGGGKGESKFERLWKAVLRDPNPSTIRTFKELFDVADPSQTLFPGGSSATTGAKINASQQNQLHRELLRRVQNLDRQSRMGAHTPSGARSVANSYSQIQHLKRVAAHAGIPLEDTFTKLEASATGRYTGYMQKHQAYTRSGRVQVDVRNERIARKQAESQQRLAARQVAIQQKQERVRQAQEVRLNKDHAIALDMDRTRTERGARLQQKTESANQAQNIRLNKDHAAALRIQQANESRAFGRSAAGIAAKYRASLTSSAIGGAEGAVAVGTLSEFRKHYKSLNKLEQAADKQVKLLSGIKGADDKELQLAQQHLTQVKSAKSRAEVMGQSRWGGQATRGGLNIGSLLEGGGLAEMLGPEALGAFLGVTGAAAGAVKLAYSGPSMLNGIANSLISGQKPYMDYMLSSSRLAGQFGLSGTDMRDAIYTPGGKIKSWMAKEGLTPTGALKMLSAGGGIPTGFNHINSTLKVMRNAQLSPYLRGLSDAELGSLRTTGTLAGVTTGVGQNLSKYYEKLAESVEKGTEKGVNRATILHGLTASIHTLAANNSVLSKSSMGGIGYLYNKMLLGGMPGARLGSLQQSAFSELSHTTSNLTNSPARMTYALQYMMHLNHGKLPTSQAGFKKIAGKSIYNSILKNPAQKYLMESGLRAFKSGNDYVGLYELQKVLGPFWSKRLANFTANEIVAPGQGLMLPIKASLSGTKLKTAASVFYHSAYRLVANVPFSVDHIVPGTERIRAARLAPYIRLAALSNKINPLYLAGIAGAESGMGKNTVNGATHGVFQVTPETWKQFSGGLPYADANNPKYDALVSGRYVRWLQKKYHYKGKKLYWHYTFGQNTPYMNNAKNDEIFKHYYENSQEGEGAFSKVTKSRSDAYIQKVWSEINSIKASQEKMNSNVPTVSALQAMSNWSSGVEKGTQSVIGLSQHLNSTTDSLDAFNKSIKNVTKQVQGVSSIQAKTGLNVH